MNRTLAKSIVALAAAAGICSIPTTAKADGFGFRIEHRDDVRREEVRRVWVEPVFEDRCEKVWVPATYRTDCEKVLVAPESYVTKCERVWVEPVYEFREVERFEHGRRICTRERVCVREGHWENVDRRVCVPAVYRTVERQVLVTPAHFEEHRTRVCVREGHYETVAVGHHVEPRERVSFGFDFRR
jgi:hypothetical protein